MKIQTRWFGIMMALVVGTLVFISAEGLRDYYVFPIIAIPGLIIFLLALITVGRYFQEVYEMTWSPLVASLIAATLVYLLNVAERYDYLKKLIGSKINEQSKY